MALDITRSAPVQISGARSDGPGGLSRLGGRRPDADGPSFADTLKGYLNEVRDLEASAEQQVQRLADGRSTDVHEVMLAVEEANLALDLLIQIRNRLLEAYKELSATSA